MAFRADGGDDLLDDELIIQFGRDFWSLEQKPDTQPVQLLSDCGALTVGGAAGAQQECESLSLSTSAAKPAVAKPREQCGQKSAANQP